MSRSSNFLLLIILFLVISLSAQSIPPAIAGLELPIILRQNIVAGKTPVGSKVEARLSIATLVSGTVIPENAVLSGEVTESTAKSETEPSRLSIRIDSAHWKNASAPLKVYLTAWYYPLEMPSNNFPTADHGSVYLGRGAGSSNRSDPPFPSSDPGNGPGASPSPGAPQPGVSKHRIVMTDVESEDKDGVITLTSKRQTIKLDKSTTYVLATAGPKHDQD